MGQGGGRVVLVSTNVPGRDFGRNAQDRTSTEMTASRWADALALLPPGGAVFISGCAGEPSAFLDALREDPEICRGREFRGVWIPGVNRFDCTAVVEGSTATTTFATPELADGMAAGRVKVLPLHYSGTYRWFQRGDGVAGAVFQVAPPQGGTVGLGIAADFVPALVDAGVHLIGQVNPEFPDAVSSPRIAVDRFAALVEAPSRLIEYDPGSPTGALCRIAGRVAGLIGRDDTVQLGLGKLSSAVTDALSGMSIRGFHGGMVSDSILDAVELDGIQNGIAAGVALGSRAFYERAASDARVSFLPVCNTHFAAALSRIQNFVAVNSVLEVDLFGQCNGEFVAGRQITGHGGLLDFIRGAMASKGGRSILALPSTAAGGKVSRVVVRLDPARPVTVARSDVQWIVTECGAVNLETVDPDRRAELLISVAHPDFRDRLADGWSEIRAGRLARGT